MKRELTPSGNLPDHFDRKRAELHGLPDVAETRPSIHRATEPVLGTTQTFIVQTVRQADRGDTIFLECYGAQGRPARLVLPPRVADAIARQRDALGTTVRSRTGKRLAQERKARGEVPGFLRAAKS